MKCLFLETASRDLRNGGGSFPDPGTYRSWRQLREGGSASGGGGGSDDGGGGGGSSSDASGSDEELEEDSSSSAGVAARESFLTRSKRSSNRNVREVLVAERLAERERERLASVDGARGAVVRQTGPNTNLRKRRRALAVSSDDDDDDMVLFDNPK